MNDDSQLQDAVDRGRHRLAAIQAQLRTGSHHVAEEGDRWFLAALRGVDRGLRLSRSGASIVGTRVADGWDRLRSVLPRRPARRRIHEALVREARRSSIDPDTEAFQTFAESMATLLELVLAGAIELDDVGFSFDVAAEDSEEAAG